MIIPIFVLILTIGISIYLLCNYNIFRRVYSFKYPRILMYHSVSNETSSGMNIRPYKFEKHIKYLIKNNFKIKKISNLSGEFKEVCITFDDGFENNYTNAFKILQKYNVPATIYIATKIDNIKVLSKSQIQEMVNSNLIEIGSHTVNHINLTSVSKEEAEFQIMESKKYIMSEFATPCDSFAYPFGKFDENIAELVKLNSYKTAVTTKKRVYIPEIDNKMMIPRISINGKINVIQFYIALMCGRYKF